jgi:hypothetical protein
MALALPEEPRGAMLITPYVYFESYSVIAERRPEAAGRGQAKA